MSDKTMRTDLGRVRGLGSAKEGVHHWWAQRLTAIALLPLGLWFAFSAPGLIGADHATAVAWLASPFNTIATALFVIAMFHHAQLGLQVVVEDYVHGEAAKLTVLIAVKFAALALGVISLYALLKIAFGG
ncbi:MAG: succinate dehydrogenase, hydrophobic membrane anchor protein [Rhodospirillaceae bacterium]|nr:succinate dehydrogenase, hydrophobic membrane anchor protein [Rhodospirillaceae bacterium]MBT6138909.1 succinate dehydrogenase, hydrophobic membrane anchor protein [Rhodospirillaceae bacterium]